MAEKFSSCFRNLGYTSVAATLQDIYEGSIPCVEVIHYGNVESITLSHLCLYLERGFSIEETCQFFDRLWKKLARVV